MSRRLRSTFAAVLAAMAVLGAMSPAAAGGGCHSTTFTDRTSSEVKAEGACFFPTVARVGAGDTVTWSADDGLAHTVTGVAGSFADAAASGSELTTTTPVSVRFDAPGVYPYVCLLHPAMAGAIVVGDGSTATASTVADSSPALTAQTAAGSRDSTAAAIGLGAAGALLLLALAVPRVVRAGRTRRVA